MSQLNLVATTPSNKEIASLANNFVNAIHEYHLSLVNEAQSTLTSMLALFKHYRGIKQEYSELFAIVDAVSDALADSVEEMDGYDVLHNEVERLFTAIEELVNPANAVDENDLEDEEEEVDDLEEVPDSVDLPTACEEG